MRKLIIISMMLIASMATFAQDYYVYHAPTAQRSEYTLDNKFADRDASTYVGVMTRFGYSFSDNGYFAYGASVYYTFNSLIGITAGFDGYAGTIYIYDDNNDIVEYNGASKSLPMWDVRAGITLGKYVALGAIYGQCNICTRDVRVVHKYSEKLTTGLGKHGSFYGAFGTVMCPISSHLALNFDISYTNHTSFTLALGVNVRFKVK